MEYANLCTFISYLISYLHALEKIFNLQMYVCGMLKHFLKLCSKKPQKSSPEFSRLCGRPPLPSRGGGQHATVTHECVRQCVRLPSRAWCHQDSTHWLPSRCTSHSLVKALKLLSSYCRNANQSNTLHSQILAT